VLEHKFYFDELYDALFYRPAVWIAGAWGRYVERPLIGGSLAGIGLGAREASSRVASVQTGFSDLHFELQRAAHGDDFTAGEWTATMTHSGELEGLRATGRRVSSAGVDVATLDEKGQITHLVSYYDGAAIMRELGVLPPRGSRLERALVRAASLLPRRP